MLEFLLSRTNGRCSVSRCEQWIDFEVQEKLTMFHCLNARKGFLSANGSTRNGGRKQEQGQVGASPSRDELMAKVSWVTLHPTGFYWSLMEMPFVDVIVDLLPGLHQNFLDILDGTAILTFIEGSVLMIHCHFYLPQENLSLGLMGSEPHNNNTHEN